MPVTRALLAILFSGILGAYLLSLAGVLFVAGDAWLVGMAAFLATVGTLFLRKGAWFARRRLTLPALWRILFPLFVTLFLATVALSFDMGAPEVGEEPILAARERYLFGRTEVARWRFVAVAASFHVAWHLLGIGFALSNWRGVIQDRSPGAGPESPPPGGFAILREHARQVRTLAAKARRGRFSLTHFKRIRRFVHFSISSVPIFYCVFVVFVALIALSAIGWLPFSAPALAFGLLFLAMWIGWALDLVIAVWEKDVLTSLWMLLWVAGGGFLLLAIVRSAVSSA